MPWFLTILLATAQLLPRLAGRHTSQTNFVHGPPQPKSCLDIIAHYKWLVYQTLIAVRRLTDHVKRTMLPRSGEQCACCAQIENTSRGRDRGNDYVSLAQLQEAGVRFRCERCGVLGRCIAKFAVRWQPNLVASKDVRVDKWRLNMVRTSVDEQSVLVRWPDGSTNVPSYPGYGYALLSIVILYGESVRSGQYALGGEFCGPVPRSSDSDTCFKFIQQRIQHCMLHHKLCRSPITEYQTLTPFLPTRLIELSSTDLNDVHLIETHSFTASQRQSTPYLALSYCWGAAIPFTKPVPKLTQQNISARLMSIPIAELTQAFCHALRIAHQLGIRHIWIDALCILQDSPSDFSNEASQMAMIYGTAQVVISATRAASGDEGIFHHRIAPYEAPYIDTKGRQMIAYVKEADFHKDFVLNDPGDFRRAPVFARAWCFQERLLARRVVHFAEAEIVWECNELVTCECGSMSRQETGVSGAVNFKTRQARRFVTPSSRQHADQDQDMNLEHRSALWHECIHTYTSRLLTRESDRLPALAGYARELYVPAMGRYLAGIWEFQLPAALLWYITHPRLDDVIWADGWLHRPDNTEAPSWSWTSIQGVVVLRRGVRRKIVARAVEIHCRPQSIDTFGRVEPGAFIVIEAPIVMVILVGYGETQDQWGTRPCASIKLASTRSETTDDEVKHSEEGQNEEVCTILTDLNLTRPRCEDYVPIGSHLTCVIIEQQGRPEDASPPRGLVLRTHQSNDGHEHGYRRIGILDCPEPWLSSASHGSVKIFRVVASGGCANGVRSRKWATLLENVFS